MKEVFITEETISRYESYLRENEKAKSTIGKYVQAVRAFGCYLRQAPVTKAGLLAYRCLLYTSIRIPASGPRRRWRTLPESSPPTAAISRCM